MRRLTRERLGAALATALADAGMKERATRVAARLNGERGVERACELLERWAARPGAA